MKTLQEKIAASLADLDTREARRKGVMGHRDRVIEVSKGLDGLREELRAAKLTVLNTEESLKHYTNLASDNLLANGFKVHTAKTAKDALEQIAKIVRKGPLVKAKTNLGKELGLTDLLNARGIEYIETDLGDRINQLNGTHSSHTLAPAIQIKEEHIAELFKKRAKETNKVLESTDEQSLVSFAREDLREYLTTAPYGLSGANAIAADTGSIILTENEGNIRAVTSLPDVHIIIAGINKIVPTLEDGIKVVQAASSFGAGQEIGTYINVISAPGKEIGPKEVHVILLDNGRTKAVQEGFGEAFTCVNCGSCLNFCPVYTVVGDAYGQDLLGGIGLLQTFFIQGKEASIDQGLSLCIGCTKCLEYCPVKIDTPHMISEVKQDIPEENFLKNQLLDTIAKQKKLDSLTKLLRFFNSYKDNAFVSKTINLLPSDWQTYISMLPQDIAKPVTPEEAEGYSRGGEMIHFFLGCVMNSLFADIHRDSLYVLSKNDTRISCPTEQACCGALHFHAGDKRTAKELALKNIKAFPGKEPIIINSAGCGAMLKDYPKLFSDNPELKRKAEQFSSRVMDFSEYLSLTKKDIPQSLSKKVTFHDACHLALAQGIKEQPRELLRNIDNLELVEMPDRNACCGSGGIYSLTHTDVSRALLEEKVQDAKTVEPDIVITTNPGCLMHLNYGMKDTPTYHLATILAKAYREGEE